MRTTTNHDPVQVLRCAADLEAQISTLPKISMGSDIDMSEQHRRHRAACDQMVADLTTRRDCRATVNESSQGWRISTLGLRASSTSGFASAARNWIAQARKKFGATA